MLAATLLNSPLGFSTFPEKKAKQKYPFSLSIYEPSVTLPDKTIFFQLQFVRLDVFGTCSFTDLVFSIYSSTSVTYFCPELQNA